MSATTRWLRFAAGGLEVMVPTSVFRRTLPAPVPLPAVVEVSGEPYPVVDLGGLTGVPSGPESPSFLLVLADETHRLVLPATDVAGLIAAAPDRVEPLPWPYGGAADWCAGVMVPAGAADRPVLVLDLAALARAVSAGVEEC
jgi:chemotaxis signal transduction protein